MTHGEKGFLFCLALFWLGCAPAMMAPTAVPLVPGNSVEFGFGGMAGQNLSEATEQNSEVENMWSDVTGSEPHRNVQIWGRFNTDDEDIASSEFGLLAQAGLFSFLSGGLYWRKPVFTASETRQIGLQLEGGVYWAGVGLPLSFRVSDNVWISSMPTARYSAYSTVHLPVGVSYQLADAVRLDASAGVHGYVLPNNNPEDWMGYGAAAIAFQF